MGRWALARRAQVQDGFRRGVKALGDACWAASGARNVQEGSQMSTSWNPASSCINTTMKDD
jgi:hypothetical protein